MRKMKDSEISWIGEIPEGWKVSRVGIHYKIILGKMLCSQKLNDDYTKENYYCAANVHFGEIILQDNLKQMWFSAEEKSIYKVMEKDLLVVEGGAGAGGCAIVEKTDKDIFIQNSIMIARNKTKNDNRYLRYLIEDFVKRGYIDVVCNKATIPHFTKDKLSNMPYLVMSFDERNQIADFLDKKCAEIDKLIDLQESMIEKLKEYKQSVITQAVTKGLDPDVPMKDSGVEWIGKIPEGWNVNIGKRILILQKREVLPSDEVITCFRDGEVTLRKNRREEGFTFSEKEIGYQGIEIGDIVIHGMDGFAGAIGISDSRGKGSPVLSVCISKSNMDANYIVYYLRTLARNNVFLALATGIRERSCDLRWNKIANLDFIIPDLEEQQQIADYLDKKCAEIDNLIKLKEQKIEKLKEYKKSLIYEYVTGKKEIV